MGQPPIAQPADNGKGLYATPAEALKAVVAGFEYWSGKLTDTSVQMSYAVIAANWVAFGSLNGILKNDWSKFSILLVLVGLGANVIGTLILCESHRRRAEYGDCDAKRWATEFDQFANTRNPWPFTAGIESTAQWMRRIKAYSTLGGGLLLFIGVIASLF
jgi:hypothetical protein